MILATRKTTNNISVLSQLTVAIIRRLCLGLIVKHWAPNRPFNNLQLAEPLATASVTTITHLLGYLYPVLGGHGTVIVGVITLLIIGVTPTRRPFRGVTRKVIGPAIGSF